MWTKAEMIPVVRKMEIVSAGACSFSIFVEIFIVSLLLPEVLSFYFTAHTNGLDQDELNNQAKPIAEQVEGHHEEGHQEGKHNQ